MTANAPESSTTQGLVHYVFDGRPETGSVMQVAPGVFWLRMPLPFALDHINLWLLDDGDGWTIVDTGIASDEVKSAWRQVFDDLTVDKPVTRLICTHFHPDHFGLAGWLVERLKIPLFMTRSEWLTGSLLFGDSAGSISRQQVELFRRHGIGDEHLRALEERGNTYRRLLAPPPLCFTRISDGDFISIGGCDWQVIIGRGHAPEHACLYCAAKGVLISGDQVLPRISPNVSLSPTEPSANPLAEFLHSLEALAKLPEDTLVLPSHDAPFCGLHGRLDALIRHHHERLDRLEKYCEVPRSAAETLKVLFRRELDTHQMMFAMGESLSHLVYLEAAGRMKRITDASGSFRFVVCA